MLLNSVYFRLKPLIPRSIRMGIRRWFVQRKRRLVRDIWPIKESAGVKPKGWQGWPDGKKFAFVLTHDVESQQGLDRVKELADLEMQLGFRSLFNFVPEGPYTVPVELREWLTDHGFEIGVHDLNHDGRLFSSQASFRRKARRINDYLERWNAVGFRSAYMLRNLEWIQDLNIAYDASTFDTDPFEPQPDGVNTIFPFWVRRRSKIGGQRSEAGSRRSEIRGQGSVASPLNHPRSGYVELPYTLPQDSTLFLLLQEKTSEIWKRKLDWIAAHGGMALVNVHPDYIRFGIPELSRHTHTYPIQFFTELLRYVRQNYGDSVWHALPNEVAALSAWRCGSGAKDCFRQGAHADIPVSMNRRLDADPKCSQRESLLATI